MKLYKVLLIRLFIGVVFLFSGVVKLFPILAFEIQLAGRGFTNWLGIMIISRILIGAEIFLGLGFFQKSFLKKFFIPIAAVMLLVYSLDLIRTIIISGWGGNCGCFGQIIVLTPLEALIKNIFLFAGLYYIYKNIGAEKRGSLIAQISLLALVFLPLFLYAPMRQLQVEDESSTKVDNQISRSEAKNTLEKTNINLPDKTISTSKHVDDGYTELKIKTISVGSLARFKNFNGESNVDFKTGNKLVAFLSLDCGSCLRAASVIDTVGREIKLPKVYYLFLGEENQVANFFKETHTSFPYKILDDLTFFSFIKNYPPRVILFKDGKAIGDWGDLDFNTRSLKAGLKKAGMQ